MLLQCIILKIVRNMRVIINTCAISRVASGWCLMLISCGAVMCLMFTGAIKTPIVIVGKLAGPVLFSIVLYEFHAFCQIFCQNFCIFRLAGCCFVLLWGIFLVCDCKFYI